MSERIDCIQMKTGNCGGCEILEIVDQRVLREGANARPAVMRAVSQEWCPPGTQMLVPESVRRSRVW